LQAVRPNDVLRAKGKLIIGYVGVIGVQDGVDCMIRMLGHLRHDLKREDFHAVIVGTGTALASIKQLAQELNVDDAVTFTGHLSGDDLLRTIAAFDICITPDPSNPYNDSCTTIKTMEYMAMSKPTVAFDLPENRLSAGDSGVYATDNDEMQLATLTNELMDNNLRRDQMGAIGRELVETRFAWRHQRENLVALYASLLHPAAMNARHETIAAK
jgi:glycosyltransferase involved in cell wall biosynthesis